MPPFEAGVLSDPATGRRLAYAQRLNHRPLIIEPPVFVAQSRQWRVGERIEGTLAMTAAVTLQIAAIAPAI